MRTCLIFIFAIMLPLNAAYAAASGLCDAWGDTSSHAEHFGHHNHEHSDDHDHDEPTVDADVSSNLSEGSDHHHAHLHPVFSGLLSGEMNAMSLDGSSPLVLSPLSTFISAPQKLIEYPPRAALA